MPNSWAVSSSFFHYAYLLEGSTNTIRKFCDSGFMLNLGCDEVLPNPPPFLSNSFQHFLYLISPFFWFMEGSLCIVITSIFACFVMYCGYGFVLTHHLNLMFLIGESVLVQEAESTPPHKIDENMWKNREQMEEMLFLLKRSNWPTMVWETRLYAFKFQFY